MFKVVRVANFMDVLADSKRDNKHIDAAKDTFMVVFGPYQWPSPFCKKLEDKIGKPGYYGSYDYYKKFMAALPNYNVKILYDGDAVNAYGGHASEEFASERRIKLVIFEFGEADGKGS